MAKGTLDLHGFHTDQVVDAVDNFLYCAKGSRVRIMTGKGKGKVKKTVLDYLRAAGYQWEYEKMNNGLRNEGVLVIFLD